MTLVVELVVILASLLFLDLALKCLNLGILWLRMRVSKLLCNWTMLLHSHMLTSFSEIFAIFRTSEFSWLAWLLVALIGWWICVIVVSHAYVFKVDIVVHVVKLSLSYTWLIELGEHIKLFMNILRRVSLCMSKHLILIKIFASLLLYLHLHSRCCFATLSLWSGRVWCSIAIVFLCGKVVGIAICQSINLVLLGVVSLKLIDRTSFVLLPNVVSILISRASTQPTKLILSWRIPYVFFILIFNDYFSEEVVCRILTTSLLLSECVGVLLTAIKITLFIWSNLLLFLLIVWIVVSIRLFLSPSLILLITYVHLTWCIICAFLLMYVNGMQQTSSTIAFLE